ncbi:MAG: flagellar hook-associated protein FlgL [Gammaproteobacteria bacterium]|nr:flagellar hook-associated protein FlgL [Gammaproteobacteria bacterium]
MRISSHQSQQMAINAMIDQQNELSKVQQQVATGKKIFKPSDDPVAASQIINLRDVLGSTEQYQSNIQAARARLNLEEGVLKNVTDVIQRIRELTVGINNDSLTPQDRSFIAEEVEQLLDEMVNLSNSTDSSGEFLFSGSKTRFRPFSRNNEGGFDYHGDDSQRFIQISSQRQIATSDSGSDVFRNIKDGNGYFTIIDNPDNKGAGIISPGNLTGDFQTGTYIINFSKNVLPDGSTDISYKVTNDKNEIIVPEGTPYNEGDTISFNGVNTYLDGEVETGDFFVVRPSQNQDVFTTIYSLVDSVKGLTGEAKNRTALHNEVNRTLLSLDRALENVLEVRAGAGARLNALDGQEDINNSYIIQIRENLSRVEDLDYSEAVSDLNLKLAGLEASQKAFTRVQGISLFNYI